MKKILTKVLSLAAVTAMVGCSSGTAASSAAATSSAAAATTGDGKIGVILVGDENEGYTAAHMDGIREAASQLGIADDQIIWKYSIGETQDCYDAAVDLVDQGATLIVSNSYGHQGFMEQAASENPDVTFVAMTGDTAALSGLPNFKNAFNHTYESRYVSGVVAGMKLQELIDNGTLTKENLTSRSVMSVLIRMRKSFPATLHSISVSNPLFPMFICMLNIQTHGLISLPKRQLQSL